MSSLLGRMRRLARLGLPVALALIAGCDSTASTGPGHTVNLGTTLQVAFTAHTSFTYKVHMTTDLSTQINRVLVPLKSDTTGQMRIQVVSTDSAGVSTITITPIGFVATANGRTVDLTGKLPSSWTVRIGKDGQVLGLSASSGPVAASGTSSGLQHLAAVLPDHGVQPGDSWTKDVTQPNPFGTGTITSHSDNKFLRNDTISGVKLAVIHSTGSGHMDATVSFTELLKQLGADIGSAARLFNGVSAHIVGAISFDETSWLDAARKELIKTTGSTSTDISETLTGPPGSAGAAAGTIPVSGTTSFSFERVSGT